MRVLVTGHHGYIGSVMTGVLSRAGHDVTGFDTTSTRAASSARRPSRCRRFARTSATSTPSDLRGFDAVIHLAALSNDPLGSLERACTYDINHLGSVQLARAAKAAGVPRFLFASSCSLYGAAGDEVLTEDAAFNPMTAYGTSKVLVEGDVSRLADDTFSPTYLRNATAYGLSSSLRADIVVNNSRRRRLHHGRDRDAERRHAVAAARPRRGHLARVSRRARGAARRDPQSGVQRRQHQPRTIRFATSPTSSATSCPGRSIRYLEGAGPDPRCYRVDCSKIGAAPAGLRDDVDVRRGAERAVRRVRAARPDARACSRRFTRLSRITAADGRRSAGRAPCTLAEGLNRSDALRRRAGRARCRESAA